MLGDRIKKARKEKGYTLDALADLYNREFAGNLSKGTLSKYENGRQQPLVTVVGRLASLLGVSADYLLGNGEEGEGASSFAVFDNLFPLSRRPELPILGEIACGVPIYAKQEEDDTVGAFIAGADFCLRAKGDSMVGARIFDGDIVFIHRQSSVNNGEIAAVIIDDEATLKRVYYYPEKNKIVLTPENPKYEPLVYTDGELERIHILGKAVSFQSSL